MKVVQVLFFKVIQSSLQNNEETVEGSDFSRQWMLFYNDTIINHHCTDNNQIFLDMIQILAILQNEIKALLNK